MLTYFFAGIGLATHWGGGMFWLMPAIGLSFIVALVGSWVMLVEIARLPNSD